MTLAMTFAAICRVLGKVWLGFGGAIILVGTVGTWYFRGWRAFLDLMNPFNIYQFIAIIITLGPGLLLLMAADALENGRRKAAAGTLAMVPVALALFAGMAALVVSGRAGRHAPENQSMFQANEVRALDGNVKCRWARDRLITVISGPCDKYTPPSRVRVGERFQANGKTKTINVIVAIPVEKDVPDLGLKTGDWVCSAAESSSDIPSVSGKYEHTGTWLNVPKCQPVQ